MSDKSSWEVVADILDELQSFVITEQGSKTSDIIKEAAQLITNKCASSLFPIPNLRFSILYQRYGDPSLSVELERGQVIPEAQTLALKESALSSYQSRIEKVVRTGEVDRAASQYLIVPMRLDPKVRAIDGQDLPSRRVVGAFLLESDADYVFQEKDARLFDRFSDGVAVLIQLGESKSRSRLTNKLHREYLGNIGKFKSEFEIFEKLLSSLTNKEVSYFYETSEINILLYSSFYQDQLYLVCENGNLDPDFRQKDAYDSNSDKMIELFDKYKDDVFNKKNNNITRFSTFRYQSNIVIPILVHHDNRIGYLLLRTKQVNAYQDEQNFLQRTADFLAATLRSFRHDSWEKNFTIFFRQYINTNRIPEDNELYEAMVQLLKKVHGKVSLAVVGLSKEARKPEFIFPSKESDEAKSWDTPILLKELENHINKSNLRPFFSENKQYYIYPLNTESGRPINFVFIKMVRDSLASTHHFIQQILEMIRAKQSLVRKIDRLTALTKFGNAITNKQNITKDQAFQLVDTYTKEVMTATNIYIALLDKKNNEITFDLFNRLNDETGQREPWPVKSRIFDPNSKVIPRTEYILKTKEQILIATKEESDQWYKDHGDSEQLGDSFASWLGVPIISEGEAIGVIAVYHPSGENLYTKKSDGVFLENIAAHISSLLVRVTLKEQNEKLKESIKDNAELRILNKELEVLKNKLQDANNNIIVKEGQLIRESLAQDLAHRWKNSISGIQTRAIESIDFLNKYFQSPQKPIDDLYAIINEAKKILGQMTFSPETMPERENVDVYKLIKDIVENLESEFDISELSIVRIDCIGNLNDLYTYKSLLEMCLFSVIQNAFKAVRKKIDSSINFKFYILIRIHSSEDGRVIIEIEDNGEPIPENLRDNIFSLGVKDNDANSSGYGLYRARQVFELIGGSIEFTKGLTKPYDVKAIHIEIPNLIKQIRTAVIIEDQEIWLDPLASWLAQEGFETKKASRYEDAISLCKVDYKKDDLFVIDIALNEGSSINRDGLKIVNLLRKKTVSPKVVLFTSYHNAAEFYKNRVDLIIKKSENGSAITKKTFIERINELYKDE